MVRIHEIYDTIQGESSLAGTACTLVRLAGCPLRCRYCDTPDAWSFDRGHERSISSIVDDIENRDRPLVLVTGGEPLAQPPCVNLLSALIVTGRIIQLETSGAFDISCVPAGVYRIIDLKTPGSGEMERNLMHNLELLRQGDEIKFVIMDHQDYLWSREIISTYNLTQKKLPILFSPVWDKLETAELARWVLEDRLPVRLHLQQHKVIWGGQAKGV